MVLTGSKAAVDAARLFASGMRQAGIPDEVVARFSNKFGLKEIFVVPTSKTDTEMDVMRAVGKTGALYLETNLKPDQILTIAWGRMMFEVARALSDKPVSGLVVAQ